MKTHTLAATLMAFGLLVAAPAFAQTTPVQKQPTQEGGGPSMPTPIAQPFNANPAGDPNFKQRTQEGGGSSMATPCGAPFNANPAGDPDCKKK